jgi:hypothetical protein
MFDGLCGRLGLQGLVKANPGQRDQAHRDRYKVLAVVASEARGPVGYPAKDAQQGQLVGGTLIVVEDDVAEEWESACTVVRQPDGHLRPANIVTAQSILGFPAGLDESAVPTGESLHLVERYGMDASPGSAGPCRSVMARRPPGFMRLISLRKARLRSLGATCVQTALRRITSNEMPDRVTVASSGRASLIHLMPAPE